MAHHNTILRSVLNTLIIQLMSSRKRSNNKPEVLLTDMYALKFSALWNALKAEHVSLWMLCGYFFFEYVRPQNLYPVLDILPWGMFFLIASAITALADKSARWESNIENKLFIAFTLVLILSGIFAFKPSVSANYATVFGSWFMVYFITIRVVNTEKRLLLFILAYCLFNFKMSQHGAGQGATFRDMGVGNSILIGAN